MRRLVVVFTSMLFVIGTIGSNIGPALVDERPALVLLLSSRNRNLFGSVPFISLQWYAIIGFVRVLVAALALFFVGRWFGEKTMRWVEGNVGELPAIYRLVERFVDRAGWLAVVLMPGSNIVCLLVGHRKMEPQRFVPLVSVGIVLKLVVLWFGGKVFEDQIRTFLDFIDAYQWWLVIALFAISLIQSQRQNRPRADPAPQ